MLEAERSITVVLVGDTKIGKSALINRITKNAFSEDYTPTSFDKVVVKRNVEGKWMEFALWDTSGCSAYDNVRSLPYEEAHVFLLCFKISDPSSLASVRHKWMKELRRHRPEVPVILCGCQADLRHDPATIAALSQNGRTPVAPETALSVCCEIDAVSYVETSSKEGDALSEVFEVCAHAGPKEIEPQLFRKTPSSSSSLKNKRHAPGNVSFSGSEAEIHHSAERGFSSPLKRTPLSYHPVNHPLHHPPILGCLRASQSQPTVQEDLPEVRRILFPPPPAASSSLVSPCCSEPPFLAVKAIAHSNNNGLSRRTSFRSQRLLLPPPPPKSSEECLSQQQEEDTFDPKSLPSSKHPLPNKQKTTYESIKSHTSTGSTVSKTSSCSTSSLLVVHPGRPTPPSSLSSSDILDPPDEALNKFNFISPKTGVFRPINNAQTLPPNSKLHKKKQHCSLM
eukprot:TRINITY_DN6691_c0_g1_i2.p1 TRINITY_DN6691_c0_g1~~TRINITY_DN6691_c0_g1_i2.p1  ORF type:complete len:452 (-),score=146.95 TRINITY_DN6691_c0_g1_i2:556-1911(-)